MEDGSTSSGSSSAFSSGASSSSNSSSGGRGLIPSGSTPSDSSSEFRSVSSSKSKSSSGDHEIPSGSTSSTSSGASSSRRGLISCLHSHHCRVKRSPLLSDDDLPQAIQKLIVGFYEEAFNRLPCDAMPDLLRVLTTDGGGSCLGLLDPVSNIILNTLALLPQDAAAAAAQEEESKTAAKTRGRRSKRQLLAEPAQEEAKRGRRSKRQLLVDLRSGDAPWLEVAYRSYNSILAFLTAYFGCLTQQEAARYLYSAKANLLVAVMLIQHDLYVVEEGELFDAESDRTKAALEYAATIAGHPSPTTLARVMSSRLNDADLALFKTRFSDAAAAVPLTVDDVRATHRTLHMILRPKCSAKIIPIEGGMVLSVSKMLGCSKHKEPSTTEEGVTTTYTTFRWGRRGSPISSLHSGLLPHKLKKCLDTADEQKQYLKTPCGGDACDYLQSLNMYVNGIIHNLYLKALKLLPTPSGPLMRSILKAGHCYGCMDPLLNIIVNSIWYNTCGCSLSVSECREMAECNDVLDPLYLLRTQIHSLRGLTKLAAFTDPKFSVPDCALELLCSAKCNIANMLRSPTETSQENPFQKAAEAAGHPQPLCLGALHQQLLLMPDVQSELRSFITEAQTNGTVLRIDDMALCISALWNSNRSELQTVQPLELSQGAKKAVSRKRSEYEEQRSELRPKIEQLLKEYMTQQFPGPGTEYKLDTILGVEVRKMGRRPFGGDIQYNVNFTAAHDLNRHRTLFFAEFWSLSGEPRPESCCPLPFAYAGRCYYGVHIARKIVYPDDAKYITDDITPPGTRSVDGMLGMDLVYFSSKLDVEFAKKLNMLPSEEERKMKWRKSVKRRNLEISKLQVPIIQ